MAPVGSIGRKHGAGFRRYRYKAQHATPGRDEKSTTHRRAVNHQIPAQAPRLPRAPINSRQPHPHQCLCAHGRAGLYQLSGRHPAAAPNNPLRHIQTRGHANAALVCIDILHHLPLAARANHHRHGNGGHLHSNIDRLPGENALLLQFRSHHLPPTANHGHQSQNFQTASPPHCRKAGNSAFGLA